MDIILNREVRGEGSPLILLHGNGEGHEYFVHQIDYFSKFFKVIAVDTRGHGKSPKGEKKFSLTQFADDLSDFMDEEKIKKADILGFSDGGNIALIFAIKYPEKVNRLILNGANLTPWGVKASVEVPIIFMYLSALITGKKDKSDMLGLMVKEPHIKDEDVKKVSSPALVIAGTHDMIKESETRKIASLLKNSTLVFLEGDHFIANKKSEEFNRAVAKFLNVSED